MPLNRLVLQVRPAATAMPRTLAALPSADLTLPAIPDRVNLRTTLAGAAAPATSAHPMRTVIASLPAIDLTLPDIPTPSHKLAAS